MSLFELHARNLAACLAPEHADEPITNALILDRRDLGAVVVCPLCLCSFPRSALTNRDLTEEHIVPSGGRGRNLTLTCRKCNNRTGSLLDSHLRRRILHEENFFVEGGPIHAEVYGGQGRQNVQLFIKENEEGEQTWELIGAEGKSNPYLRDKLIEFFKGSTDSKEMRISFSLEYN